MQWNRIMSMMCVTNATTESISKQLQPNTKHRYLLWQFLPFFVRWWWKVWLANQVHGWGRTVEACIYEGSHKASKWRRETDGQTDRKEEKNTGNTKVSVIRTSLLPGQERHQGNNYTKLKQDLNCRFCWAQLALFVWMLDDVLFH